MRISTRLTVAVILLVISCFIGAVLSMRDKDQDDSSTGLPPQCPDVLTPENPEVVLQEAEVEANRIRQEKGVEANNIRLAQLNHILREVENVAKLVQNADIKKLLNDIRQYIVNFIEQPNEDSIEQDEDSIEQDEDSIEQETEDLIQKLDHNYVQKDTENRILGFKEFHILETKRGKYILKGSDKITPIEDDPNPECPICYESINDPVTSDATLDEIITTPDGKAIFSILTTECGHHYHSPCLLPALKNSNRCLCCKKMLLLVRDNSIIEVSSRPGQ